MNPETQRLLTPFYFGSVSEPERLRVEQELLIDSEALVGFLDLKRQLEAAPEIPLEPSAQLWQKLSAQIKPRRRFILSLSLAAGFAAAAFFIATIFLTKTAQLNGDTPHDSTKTAILFDSGSELSSGTNVL